MCSYSCQFMFQSHDKNMANPKHPSPFTLWNKLLHGEIKEISSGGMREGPLLIKSQLQPGEDGSCTLMVLLLSNVPTWYNIPCQTYLLSPVLICKRRREKMRSSRQYSPTQNEPSICRDSELFVLNKCIKYSWGLQRASQSPLYVNGPDKRYLVRVFSYITWYTLLSYQLLLVGYLSEDKVRDLCIKISLPRGLQYDFGRDVFVAESTCKIHVNVRTISFTSKHYNPKAYCQYNQAQCTDGTCVSQDNLCFNDGLCTPSRCTCQTNGIAVTDHQFCRTSCKPGICFCPYQHFQCVCGGCIQMNLICDGVIHCADASDEICRVKTTFARNTDVMQILIDDNYFCLGHLCPSGECIYLQQVNDLLPDCPGHEAADEPAFLRLRQYGEYLDCIDPIHIPCVAGLSVCYPIDKFCLFEINQNGHTRWCRDGSHLGHCAFINCTNSYKCPASYCIPFHRVCDGNPDCIDAEDEASCNEHLCKGLLRCTGSKICVHPVHICDGINHCPNADDEHLCDMTLCPSGCNCLSYSMICTLNLPDVFPSIAFNYLKHLSIIDSTLPEPNFGNICDVRGLVFLNLSGNHLTNICDPLQFEKDCQIYKTLVILDLSHNDILHVRSLCFYHLQSLKAIFLSYNPLHNLNTNALSHPMLTFISLRGSQKRSLTGKSLRRIPNLYTLDVTGIYIESIDDYFKAIVNHIPDTRFNDIRLCCIFRHHRYCSRHVSLDLDCPTLLPHVTISYTIFPVGVFLVLINVAAFSLNYKYMPNAKYHKIVSFLTITDAILASYLAAVGMADILYGPNFVLTIKWWGQGIFCMIMEHVTTMATILSIFLTGLLAYHFKQAATQITLSSKNRSHNIMLSKYSFIIMSALLTASLKVIENFTDYSVDKFYCNRMGDSRMNSHTGLISVVTLSVLMATLMLGITTFTAQLLYHVRKSSQNVECISRIKNASYHSRAHLTRFMLAIVITKWMILLPYPLLQLTCLIWGKQSDEAFFFVMISFIILECFSNPVIFVLRPLLLRGKWC